MDGRVRGVAALTTALGLALAGAATVQAAPECTRLTPTTTQCVRGTHTQINTTPNVVVNTGPFSETPWAPIPPVFGVGGWALPWWVAP